MRPSPATELDGLVKPLLIHGLLHLLCLKEKDKHRLQEEAGAYTEATWLGGPVPGLPSSGHCQGQQSGKLAKAKRALPGLANGPPWPPSLLLIPWGPTRALGMEAEAHLAPRPIANAQPTQQQSWWKSWQEVLSREASGRPSLPLVCPLSPPSPGCRAPPTCRARVGSPHPASASLLSPPTLSPSGPYSSHIECPHTVCQNLPTPPSHSGHPLLLPPIFAPNAYPNHPVCKVGPWSLALGS